MVAPLPSIVIELAIAGNAEGRTSPQGHYSDPYKGC